MAFRLLPVVEQLYCGYWVNATACSMPSLSTSNTKRIQRISEYSCVGPELPKSHTFPFARSCSRSVGACTGSRCRTCEELGTTTHRIVELEFGILRKPSWSLPVLGDISSSNLIIARPCFSVHILIGDPPPILLYCSWILGVRRFAIHGPRNLANKPGQL